MANEDILNILKKGVQVWNEWIRKQRAEESEAWELYREEYSDVIAESDGPYYYPDEPEPLTIDLCDVDLSGIDLANADLCGVNLRGAKFIKAKLVGTELRGANLSDADFSHANLSYTDFSGAVLANTKFTSANLKRTKFDKSDLFRMPKRSFVYEISTKDSQEQAQPPPSDEKYTRPLKVFLCHSSRDKGVVGELYRRLCAVRIDPWLDEEKILPGQNWKLEIEKAVRDVDVVIVCLSNDSISKKGFVQKEITIALDVADEQPEGQIFLIPVKLEDCEVPNRLSHLQWVDYSGEKGFDRLLHSLWARAKELGLEN